MPGRKNATVRARNEFSVDAPHTLTTEQQLADAIAAPLLASDIGLKLTTFSFTENEGNRVRVRHCRGNRSVAERGAEAFTRLHRRRFSRSDRLFRNSSRR